MTPGRRVRQINASTSRPTEVQARQTRWSVLILLAASLGCQLRLGERPHGFDLAGHEVDPFEPNGKVTVLLFTSTDCPISNRYAPEVRRLYEKFADRDVTWWLVYSEPAASVETIRAHLNDYSYPPHALRDPLQSLARSSGATVTPEAVVIGPDGDQVYRGRIDDRSPGLGQARAAPIRRDLEDVLETILAGRRVERRMAPAVGCQIPSPLPR